MTTALILCCALILDALLGEPDWLWRRLPHPAVLMGRAVGWLEARLNRGANPRAQGLAALLLLVTGAASVGWVLSLLGPIAELVLAAILLAQRSLAEHVTAVADGLDASLGDGRRMVARIVSRDTMAMDEPQVARAAIESAAENLSDGVIAPAFWFLVAGLPGILVYKVVNTADSMVGYRTERFEKFGWASARFDDLLNLGPARLTGALFALVGHQWKAWPDIAADARRHRSPNAGWPEAALARSLDISLAGPRSYDGELRNFAWVNAGGRQEIGAAEVNAAVAALWQVWRVVLIIVALTAGMLALL
ncbi:MAG: adenosylcobinamide-phosphate synthase CbiB [Pseudomonadota bacterium]